VLELPGGAFTGTYSKEMCDEIIWRT
jgi:hypothetical protein